MSFEFLPFTKLKNNFIELKEILPPEENEGKIKFLDNLITQLIALNIDDMEKSKILTAALQRAQFVFPTPKSDSPKAPVWRIVDLDPVTPPRQVSQPIKDIASAIGEVGDNFFDEVSQREASMAYVKYMRKSVEDKKREHLLKRNLFAKRFEIFTKNQEPETDTLTPRKN